MNKTQTQTETQVKNIELDKLNFPAVHFVPSIELTNRGQRIAAVWRPTDNDNDTMGIELGNLYMDTPLTATGRERLVFVSWKGRWPFKLDVRPFQLYARLETPMHEIRFIGPMWSTVAAERQFLPRIRWR
jgi:hypothetical protein